MNSCRVINEPSVLGKNGPSSENGKHGFSRVPTAIVVDDTPAILEPTAAIMESLGYEVRTAVQGCEALSQLKKQPCDLLLTDYEMPIINGYQLSRSVKSLSARTRIIIMTGLCESEMAALKNDDIIDGWLFKPFSINTLETILSRIGLSPRLDASLPAAFKPSRSQDVGSGSMGMSTSDCRYLHEC